MKRYRMFLCLLLVLILLAGCGEKAATAYTVNERGYTLYVDLAAGTITDESGLVYTVSYSGNRVTITYPNGATYWWTQTDKFGAGGSSDDYDSTRYVPGNVIIDAMSASQPKSSGGSSYGFFGILFIALGVFNAWKPEWAWYISKGWQFRDAEPSDAALGMTRFGGIIAIILGVILFFA